MSYAVRKFLSEIDLFAGLPDDVLSDLAGKGTSMTTAPGKEVVHEGAADAGLRVILEGSAEVTVHGVKRGTMGPGQYFGEISLIDGQPRSATLTAGPTGITTYALSPLALEPLLKTRPEVAIVLLNALCARIRLLERQDGA